jgi:ribosomal protein L29
MLLQNFLHKHGISLVILGIFWVIISLLFIDASRFSEKSLNKERISPYVFCTQWTTIVSDENNASVTLEVYDKKNLTPGQRIRTNRSSTATIFWADGSVSRLAEETEIVVNELVTKNNGATKVNISMNSWKNWTNTSRILDEESSFKIQYESGERVAAVRGTIFDINLVDGYVFTESHAIEITDEKGELITSIPQGKWLTIPRNTTEKEVEIFTRAAKDWIESNSDLDTVLGTERAKKLQDAVEKLKNDTYFERVQNWLRSLFWLKERIPPYSITLTNSGIKIDIETEKLSIKDRESLEQIYSQLTWLPSKVETVDSKQQLQEVLLWIGEAEAKERYNEWFARSNLYDSWELAKELREKKGEKAEILFQNAREKLKGHSEIEWIKNDIERLEKALPKNIKDSLQINNTSTLDASADIIGKIGESIQNTTDIIGNTWKKSIETLWEGVQWILKDRE